MQGGTKEIPIQINGKLKSTVTVNADASPEEILEAIKQNKVVIQAYQTNNVKREIYVPGKIYNLVV